MKDFNHLISGQANIIAAMGAAQKNLVDGWMLEDYEEMGGIEGGGVERSRV